MQSGLNEVVTLKSSKILICSHLEQSICIQSDRHDAIIIKMIIKIRSETKRVNGK
jgi:hypothetical protein